MALDEDEYSSCVIDCLDYGDQTTARESAEIGEDVSEEAEASNEVVEVRPSETTVRTTRSGPRGGALGYFLGGYVPPGTPNWHPFLEKISPKIDTPF